MCTAVIKLKDAFQSEDTVQYDTELGPEFNTQYKQTN